MSTTDVTKMSVADLKKHLADKEKEEREENQRKRKNYEGDRNELINSLGVQALQVFDVLAELKTDAFTKLLAFKDKMLEYGDLRNGEKNRGNFELKNERFKINFSSQVVKKFDERANLAEAKMNEFLTSFVKKKDKKMYDLVASLLQRKEDTGEFDHDMISRLYARENDYDDPNWLEAIRLFKESYCPANTATYIRISRALPNGGWENIVLDFAKLKAAFVHEPETAEA